VESVIAAKPAFLVLASATAIGVGQQSRGTSTGGSKAAMVVGPDSVWKIPDQQLHAVIGELQQRCRMIHGEAAFAGCVVGFMQENGASPQAIRFTRIGRGERFEPRLSGPEPGHARYRNLWNFVGCK